MKKNIFILVFYIYFLNSQVPNHGFIAPVVDSFELKIIASVSQDSTDTTFFVFKYTLINTSNSKQPIDLFEIINGPRQNEPADTVIAPSNWETPLKESFWQAKAEIQGLSPGDTLTGFIYKTWRLPDISYWYAEGRDTFYIPIIFDEKAAESLDIYYYRKTPFGPGKYGKTVGSGPPPPMKSSWPWGHYPDSAFIHLRDRLFKCKQEGWVTEHAYDQIYRIIGHAWNHIENGRLEQSKKTLTRLMKTLQRFKEQEKITPEAFYILYYRTKYVRDNLWYNP